MLRAQIPKRLNEVWESILETVTFELRSKERVKVNEFKVRRMVSEA